MNSAWRSVATGTMVSITSLSCLCLVSLAGFTLPCKHLLAQPASVLVRYRVAVTARTRLPAMSYLTAPPPTTYWVSLTDYGRATFPDGTAEARARMWLVHPEASTDVERAILRVATNGKVGRAQFQDFDVLSARTRGKTYTVETSQGTFQLVRAPCVCGAGRSRHGRPRAERVEQLLRPADASRPARTGWRLVDAGRLRAAHRHVRRPRRRCRHPVPLGVRPVGR